MREKGRILWVLASLGVAAGIFYSTSMTGEVSGAASMGIIERVTALMPFLPFSEDTLNFILRKGAHFVVFFALAFCVAQALKYYMGGRKLFFCAWGTAAVYGVLDEIHQYFIPGRGCAVGDMVINATGAAVGTGLVLLLLRKRAHIVEGTHSSKDIHTAKGQNPDWEEFS
ncbi:MAG: VanZ family protein [Defluviitaleaceae bacterium]|nr:VanZ family protein [Defluviitaleaceae bacterium]MCL2274995.1 VanZ family protein [Defluviitaleaceae bacterium]